MSVKLLRTGGARPASKTIGARPCENFNRFLDAELRVRTANRAFYEMFHMTPAETEGQLIYTLGNGQWNIPRLRELLEDILSNNTQLDDFDVEYDFLEIGFRSMRLNARRVRFDRTLPPHILVAIEDVTDRLETAKTLQESLRESQQRMAAIVHNVVEGVVTINEHGIIDFVNPAAAEMFGDASGELQGQNINVLMPSTAGEEHQDYVANYLRTGAKQVIGIPRDSYRRGHHGKEERRSSWDWIAR